MAELEQVCGIKSRPKKENMNELSSGQKSTKTQHRIKLIAILVLNQRSLRVCYV
jgi:hypothetical protein